MGHRTSVILTVSVGKTDMWVAPKHGIYELPHELPNNLDLGSFEIRKYQENS